MTINDFIKWYLLPSIFAVFIIPFSAARAAVCDVPANEIVAENCLPGVPSSQWDVVEAGDLSIQGFATDISVNRGNAITFKVDTPSTDYRIDVYRLGWYNGNGARFISSINPSATLPQNQPDCLHEEATGLIDCGNWAVSASWLVPANATSGVYIARLVREDVGGDVASHIAFVVRNDASNADILFQTSDTTWQAYNNYGGNSLYTGAPVGRAYKVSYNRPFNTRAGTAEDWLFNAEYPMIRWLERNGFDVAYFTGVDSDRLGALIQQHKIFLSIGHDEYWSNNQRLNVEAARNAGVNLVFLSGNQIFWRTRLEPSIDGSNTNHRTITCYKETHANAKIDPVLSDWTGTWRDSRPINPLGANSENSLAGNIFTVNCCSYAIEVPAAEGKMRLWRNTSIAALSGNQVAQLPSETLGYEWNEDIDNGSRPAGTIRLSRATHSVPQRILDQGTNYGPGTATHHLTLYRHTTGPSPRALVFSAGSVQWSWGLDDHHDRGNNAADSRMQQATVNLFADMQVQATTLQNDLVAATASIDNTPPSSTITFPAPASTVSGMVTITGTASDSGGGVVGGVEVSTDSGNTWHAASGRETWSYVWHVFGSNEVTLYSRATDDSANMGPASAGVSVTQGAATVPQQGPGGPILIIKTENDPFGIFYAEIMRAEGLNEFFVQDIADVSASVLNNYDIAILATMPISPSQATMFSTWVNAGGNLIAMRPDPNLATLLGLEAAAGTTNEGYLLIHTASPPGLGITNQSMQIHGVADHWALNGANEIAALYTAATTPAGFAAITLRSVGSNGGHAAAFVYDLARSIVYTRQGNPAWAGQKRDGQMPPTRSDDLFFGNAPFDPQLDWVDFAKIAIPQADEQQRMLANLIGFMNLDRKPLPRFWYFPHDHKAVVLMTGDDHAGGGTAGRFDQYIALSSPGCSVADWECVRASSYVYPNAPLTDVEAATYTANGFEVGVHPNTGCADFTPSSLNEVFDNNLADFASQYSSIPLPSSSRTHCIAWSDWATHPKVEQAHGIRLDTNYYYWPPSWVLDRAGLFTGSGMPMRFADVDGTLIDTYQAVTQMTDESGQSYPLHINALLDRALGSTGYYGVFTANMHTDAVSSAGSDSIIASAQLRNVPIISGRQLLTWLDGRNDSSFESISWNGNVLSFSINVGNGANGLRAMLPVNSPAGTLSQVSRNAVAQSTSTKTIKGVDYAFFDAETGNYAAQYVVNTSNTLIDTSVSDFGAGTLTNTYVAQAEDGEIILTPEIVAEFASTTLPGGFETAPWDPGNAATISDGALHVDGAYVRTTQLFSAGRSLEFLATFSTENNHHIGFGVDLNDSPNWAIFSVKSDGTFNARTNNNGQNTETPLSNAVLGSPHLFRIEWDSTEVRYFIDESLVATHAATFSTNMRPIVSDLTPSALSVSVDWLRMSAYPNIGVFESRIFDAGSLSDWETLNAVTTTNNGTLISLETRSGNTAIPNGTWSSYAAVAGNTIASPSNRYLQYRATLTTPNAAFTPVLKRVEVSLTPVVVNHPPVFDDPFSDRDDEEEDDISLSAHATDLDNDTLTYSATELPDDLVINPLTGLITGTIADDAADDSPYDTTITVTDGFVQVTQEFEWTIDSDTVVVGSGGGGGGTSRPPAAGNSGGGTPPTTPEEQNGDIETPQPIAEANEQPATTTAPAASTGCNRSDSCSATGEGINAFVLLLMLGVLLRAMRMVREKHQ